MIEDLEQISFTVQNHFTLQTILLECSDAQFRNFNAGDVNDNDNDDGEREAI